MNGMTFSRQTVTPRGLLPVTKSTSMSLTSRQQINPDKHPIVEVGIQILEDQTIKSFSKQSALLDLYVGRRRGRRQGC